VHGEVVRFLTMPETKQRLDHEGATPIASTPAEFAAFVKAEIAQWSEVGREAKIQLVDR
jgi:tripartite-type tricarboxylate transporter receptor subunit TctC